MERDSKRATWLNWCGGQCEGPHNRKRSAASPGTASMLPLIAQTIDLKENVKMLRDRLTAAAAALGFAVMALAAGCSSSTGPLAPFQPQINNAADNFQFQATGVTNVTWTYTYTWSNSGDSATVNQATTVGGGSATLTILDNNNTQVYTQSLSANGTFGMTKGMHGNWTIRVAFSNYSGTVNFRVQKA